MKKQILAGAALMLCAASARAQFGLGIPKTPETQAEAVQASEKDVVIRTGEFREPYSLLWHGHEFLARDDDSQGFRVRGATLQNADGSDAAFDSKMWRSRTDGRGGGRTGYIPGYTLRNDSLNVISLWQRISDNDIEINTTIENIGNQIIRGVDIQLGTLRFPSTPAGFNGDPRLNPNRDAPAYLEADSADAKDDWQVLVKNQTPARPLIWGFPYSIDKPANRTYPLIISTRGVNWLGNLLDPYIDKPLLPGASEHIKLVLHFGTPAQIAAVKQQVLADYAQQFPMLLKWNDRRPIGMAVLSTSDVAHHSKTNPRGWLMDPKLDASNAAEFKKRMLDYARNTVRVCKAMNAQGVVVWDIEGQEFPHATSYLGDPRSLPPESDAIADDFFRVLRDGGLKVGLCVRPQRPVRGAYDNSVQQIETENPAQTLIDKIAYAKKRWGATLFYVDSNGDPNVPFPAAVFEQVLAANPDVLLIPEHQSARYYRATAPYDELRGGVASTPGWAREIYPRAFTVINVSDGDTKGRRAELLQAVRKGDVLMFRAWWDDPFNKDVKSIYEEASK